MLETPDTVDQILMAFIEYKDRMYIQCDLFNSLVGVAKFVNIVLSPFTIYLLYKRI